MYFGLLSLNLTLELCHPVRLSKSFTLLKELYTNLPYWRLLWKNFLKLLKNDLLTNFLIKSLYAVQQQSIDIFWANGWSELAPDFWSVLDAPADEPLLRKFRCTATLPFKTVLYYLGKKISKILYLIPSNLDQANW